MLSGLSKLVEDSLNGTQAAIDTVYEALRNILRDISIAISNGHNNVGVLENILVPYVTCTNGYQ